LIKKEWLWLADYKHNNTKTMENRKIIQDFININSNNVTYDNYKSSTENATPKIKKTKNYSLFKIHRANRQINKNHVKSIKKSMQKKFLISPIIVNEKLEIIDGQHRLIASKDLGLPVYYFINNNYSINEMQRLNAINKNWIPIDYLNTGVELNNQNYIDYKRFKKKYGFSHDINLTLLTDNSTNNNLHKFKEGIFKVKNYELACEYADLIYLISPYYKEFKRRRFISAILFLLKHKQDVFSMQEFVKKLKSRPNSLQNCISMRQYLELIEEIYNYRRQLKVNLRF
tara:strand:- start:1069 stop:1926 length:858 start_codon:yes stop_codon:yes gene_type:complete